MIVRSRHPSEMPYGAARSGARTRTARRAQRTALNLIGLHSAVGRLRWLHAMTALGDHSRLQRLNGLAAGCGWRVWRSLGSLVRALPVVASTRCGVCCLSLVKPFVAR